MLNENIFHTKTLILNPVKPTDFEKILKWENDSKNWLHSGVKQAYSESEIKQYVSKAEDLIKNGQTRFMISLRNNEIIGCIDLYDFNKKNRMASIGILIDDNYKQKGFGSEALNCLTLIAQNKYKLKLLKALLLADNTPSIELFKKNGFSPDDTKTTIYRYGDEDHIQLTYLKKYK